MRREPRRSRHVCFVTGTRAEFGLMRRTLEAIQKHPRLTLQLVATGMHLDPAHGDGLKSIEQAGFKVDRIAPWESRSGRSRGDTARNTGLAIAALAEAFSKLKPDIVLVTGDRVEAFAAAAAAHLSGIAVGHVHGGDRAAGQVDDSLRHAITKLAHVHFPATRQSAARIRKLGEDAWRIHRVGSPGLDGIKSDAAPASVIHEHLGALNPRRYALIVLHPVDADAEREARRARELARAAASVAYEKIVVIYPNNDPGSAGILRTWDGLTGDRLITARDILRPVFLGLLRDAAVLAGNSSSGIIEAASFGTPVVDIGDRQKGRERGPNVIHAPDRPSRIRAELMRLWNDGKPRRFRPANLYGDGASADKIAEILAEIRMDDRLLRKLICY
jgi:GDP/UDP-N,N'-diacetylbacillosamine 2-epimerase (hydrolysing)